MPKCVFSESCQKFRQFVSLTETSNKNPPTISVAISRTGFSHLNFSRSRRGFIIGVEACHNSIRRQKYEGPVWQTECLFLVCHGGNEEQSGKTGVEDVAEESLDPRVRFGAGPWWYWLGTNAF